MNQITNASELPGKTIETVKFLGCNEQAIIIFDDCTYAVFGVDFGWEQGDGDVELLTEALSNSSKRDAGFMTQKEYKTIQNKKNQKYEQDCEDRDRRQYEQLKKKYEK